MGKWGMEFMALSNKNWKFDTGDCLASNRSRIFSHIPERLALVFLMDAIDKPFAYPSGGATGPPQPAAAVHCTVSVSVVLRLRLPELPVTVSV